MNGEDLIALQKKVTSLRAEGKYRETLEAGYQLLARGMEAQDSKSILTAHMNNAASFYCIGYIEEAFNSIDAFEEVCREYGDEADQLSLYNVLFLLYEYTKDYTKAKETLRKSIEAGEKLKIYNIVSNAYSNLSHVLMVESNFEEALKMAETGLAKAKLDEPENLILQLRVKLNMAKAYIGLKNFSDSKLLLDEMSRGQLLESFIREKGQYFDLQGAWYSEQQLYKEAFESYTAAKELIESYNDVHLLKSIQEERCRLCELMGDIETGYAVQKEYIALLNEISNRDLALTALKLDIKHNVGDIEIKANTDFLTGLYNRSYMESTTNDWLKQAALKNESIVCIAFDIDNFKSINDEFGHLFGDEAIKMVSSACSKVFREQDLVGRYGGDEFAIILKNLSLENGEKKARQLGETLRNFHLKKDGKIIRLTISIGVSDNESGKIRNFKELFHVADTNLYKAKQNGKNQVFSG